MSKANQIHYPVLTALDLLFKRVGPSSDWSTHVWEIHTKYGLCVLMYDDCHLPSEVDFELYLLDQDEEGNDCCGERLWSGRLA